MNNLLLPPSRLLEILIMSRSCHFFELVTCYTLPFFLSNWKYLLFSLYRLRLWCHQHRRSKAILWVASSWILPLLCSLLVCVDNARCLQVCHCYFNYVPEGFQSPVCDYDSGEFIFSFRLRIGWTRRANQMASNICNLKETALALSKLVWCTTRIWFFLIRYHVCEARNI